MTSEARVKSRRTRLWLRRVGVVVLFLLAGAIINVLVAWGCVCWSHGGDMRSSPTTMAWQAAVPREWPDTAEHYMSTSFGVTELLGYGGPQSGVDFSVGFTKQWVFQAGWPFRAMFVEHHREVELGRFVAPLSYGIAVDSSISSGFVVPYWVPWNEPELTRPLPTRPIWTGFGINSLLYAAPVLGIFAIRSKATRYRRSKRNLCPACGYDLRGADHRKCPECGEAVAGKRRQPNSRTAEQPNRLRTERGRMCCVLGAEC